MIHAQYMLSIDRVSYFGILLDAFFYRLVRNVEVWSTSFIGSNFKHFNLFRSVAS